MLSCFPQSAGDAKTALMAYRTVVAEFDDVHVAQAVRRFLSGLVDRDNHTFAPSCPDFAIEVRKVAQRERERELAKNAISFRPVVKPNSFIERWKRGEIAKPSQESMQHVKGMLGNAQDG